MAPGLAPLPPWYAETRDSLHRVARYAVIPFRRRVDGETWLVPAPGGFGTPLLADGSRARIEESSLLLERDGRRVSAPITTLAAACELLGAAPEQVLEKPDIPGIGDPDEPLRCDPQAVAFLASWFALGWESLGEFRDDRASVDATELRLWSHHFDPSVECLSGVQGQRASYGFSPGDRGVPQPYVYVAPWQFDRAPPTGFWNATTFRGALLPLSELVAAGDPRAAAVAFLRTGRDILAAP